MDKGKEILTKRGTVKDLMRMFGKSAPTVINALKGRSANETAMRIREAARRCGGVEVD